MKQRIMALWQAGDAHQAAGRLVEAERCFREVAELTDGNPHPADRLAQVLRDLGRLDEAAEFAASAIAGAPGELVFHNTAASIADAVGDRVGAAQSYRRALTLDPGVPLWASIASTLFRDGGFRQAVPCYRRALVLSAADPDLYFELGAAYQAVGDLGAARDCYGQVLRRAPAHLATYRNLAVLAARENEIDKAELWLRKALILSPGEVELLRQLGLHALNKANGDTAFTLQRRALCLAPTSSETWGALADAGRAIDPKAPNSGGLTDLVQCLRCRIVAPHVLIGPIVGLLNLDPAFRAACRDLTETPPGILAERLIAAGPASALTSPRFLMLLSMTVLPDPGIETALTALRQALLVLAKAGRLGEQEVRPELRGLIFALAEQCLLNEHVFRETAEESLSVAELEARLTRRTRCSLPAVVHACYRPPLDLPPPDDPDFLQFHRRHVLDRRRERALAAAIPVLTPIDDDISRAVRDQYEENPYPRWTMLPSSRPRRLVEILSDRFPRREAHFTRFGDRPDILIAGCGTGQQALSAVRRYAGARILAVDLSRASLGYAERMRADLGMSGVSFALADILRLGEHDWRFDVIESIGVLHHMSDPMAGWRVLTRLLKPGGVMQIGLYSETARAPVVHARGLIAGWGLGDTADDMREARRRLMAERGGPETAALFISPDFYSLSTCRDLLFHVQEHRFTIDRLKIAIAALDLEFLGFEMTSAGHRHYLDRFPDDPDGLDFANWEVFETENPGFFGSMYRFWVRHRG